MLKTFCYQEIHITPDSFDLKVSPEKKMVYLCFDNNRNFSLKYHVNQDSPCHVFLSRMNTRKKKKTYHVIDTSCLQPLTDEKLAIWNEKLQPFQIQIKHVRENENDLIFNHILFMNRLYENYTGNHRVQYNIEGWKIKEQVINLILYHKNLKKIFDDIQAWIFLPFIRFRYDNCYYTKKYDALESILESQYDEDQYSGVTKVINNFHRKVCKEYNEIEIFQLIVDKEIHANKSVKNDLKVSLKRVIYIKDYHIENDDKTHLQVILNQRCNTMSSLEQIFTFLNMNMERSIYYQTDISFTGSFTIPIASLNLMDYHRTTKENTAMRTVSSSCEKCFQLIDHPIGNVYNFHLKRVVGSYCKQCHLLYYLQYNMKRFLDCTHFDAIVQYFFLYPNFSQIENERHFSLIFKEDVIQSLRVRLHVSDDDIKFTIKKSNGRAQIDLFLRLFFHMVFNIQHRKFYYFVIYNDIDSTFKKIIPLEEITEVYKIKVEDFDLQLFEEKTNHKELSVSTINVKENRIQEEEETELSCKDVLKYFSYTRYCGKKRTPETSFEIPDPNLYTVISWPPIEKFTKDNQYTIFLKSVKYRQPIEIRWDRQSRFVMVVQESSKLKHNTKMVDKKIIEFGTIYFYVKRDHHDFLSVTNMSPAFLPSITKKEKTNQSMSSYMAKKKQLPSPLKEFFTQLFNRENNTKFYMERKFTLENLLEEFDKHTFSTTIPISTELSYREQLYHKLFDFSSDPKMWTDIKFLYHYCCHRLQANLIIFNIENKHSIPTFKEICPYPLQYTFFNRFLFLIESLDDKNKDGRICYLYQPICFETDDDQQQETFYFFYKKTNESFFSDAVRMYQTVILRTKDTPPYHHKKMETLSNVIEKQIIDCHGMTKFIQFGNSMLCFVENELPLLNNTTIMFDLDKNMIPSLDADVTQKQLEDSILSNVGGHFPIKKINDDLFMVESKLYIFFFHLKLQSNLSLHLGVLFFSENEDFESSSTKLESSKKREIQYYFKREWKDDEFLHSYKISFVKNNMLKYSVLKRFHRFSVKNKKISRERLVETFITRYVTFSDDLGTLKKKILKLPLSYRANLPAFLKWFSQLMNKKIYMKKIEMEFLYTFDFNHSDNTIIEKIINTT